MREQREIKDNKKNLKRHFRENKTVEKKGDAENSNAKMREIAPKNYVVLGIVFIVTLLAVFGLRKWYLSYQDYKLTIPILEGKVNKISINEFEHYIIENDDVILYIEESNEKNSRAIDKDFVKVMKKREILDKVAFIDLKDENKEAFISRFNDLYATDGKEVQAVPAFVMFSDGKIKDLAGDTKKSQINMGDIEQLLDEYEIEGNSSD